MYRLNPDYISKYFLPFDKIMRKTKAKKIREIRKLKNLDSMSGGRGQERDRGREKDRMIYVDQ